MASINQNAYSSALPNFRNLGILLRIIVVANLFAIAAAVVNVASWREFWTMVPETSAVVQPLLIASLLALMACNGLLQRLPYALGIAAVLVLELGLAAAFHAAARPAL
ncbi:MAG TPA: hypothetical protein VNT02_10085, partial [Burkholderiales bacterium]|nr:hypothetical protein [Burkholderiales bacterium]